MNRINQTRFLSQEELGEQLCKTEKRLDNKSSLEKGGVPLLVNGEDVYFDPSESHTIIFGATGSKKTRNFIMPSVKILGRAGESFVAVDPKGEIYDYTKDELEARGYTVNTLNLRDFTKSKGWNPLLIPYRTYRAGDKSRALTMLHQIACMLVDDAQSKETFWVYTAREVIIGFMLVLFQEACEENVNLTNLNTLWEIFQKDRRETKRILLSRYEGTIITNKLSPIFCDSDKTVGSIESVVNASLNKLFLCEELLEFMKRNEIDMERLADEKQAFFLIVPDENTCYHFVASLFIGQLYDILIHQAQTKENRTLDNRMNFILDEFANMPKIENMNEMITASRSRNIRLSIVVQSWAQLKTKYADEVDIICGNCNNWVYLYSKEYDLLSKISALCGDVIFENGVRQPLFSEYDLQHLSKEEGEALVLIGRLAPCITNLCDIADYQGRS